MTPDPKIYRTYDIALRSARHEKLRSAALAATKAAEGSGFDVFVTGSVSRGETHPWSDLDFLVRGPPDNPYGGPNIYSIVEKACRNLGVHDVDVVDEDDIVDALRAPMLDFAIPAGDIPALGNLPDPGIIPARCVMSLRVCLDHVTQDIERRLGMSYEGDLARMVYSTTWSMARHTLESKVNLSLKRLALFQDGGRSGYLDRGSTQDLRDLLSRLAAPATEPFERPAVIPETTILPLTWLLDSETEDDEAGQETGVRNCIAAVEDWIALLDLMATPVPETTTNRTAGL